MGQNSVKILSHLKLPDKSRALNVEGSHLTSLDNSIYPSWIDFMWIFENGIDFMTLKNGIEKLLEDENYEAILTAEYKRLSDGRWHRSDKTSKKSIWLIEAKIDFNGNVQDMELPPGLINMPNYAFPDAHTGKLKPVPKVIIQHTQIGSGHCAVAIAMLHSIGDTSSFFMLIDDLAKCCRGENIEKVVMNNFETFPTKNVPDDWQVKCPHKLLDYPPPNHGKLRKLMLRREDAIYAPLFKFVFPKMFRLFSFNFKRETIDGLKAKTEMHLSANDVISAIAFRALVKARISKMKDKVPKEFTLMWVMSVKKEGRVDPPLHKRYFGNTILMWLNTIATETIVNEDDENVIIELAKLNRQHLKAMDNLEAIEKHLKYLQSVENQFGVGPDIDGMIHPSNVTITNWTPYHMIDPKFNASGKVLHNGFIAQDFRSVFDGMIYIVNGPEKGFVVTTAAKFSYAEEFIKHMTKYSEICK